MIAMPGISDAALLEMLLSNPQKLTDAQLESFTTLAADPEIRIGRARMLKGDRDRALSTARALGILPPIAEKAPRPARVLHQDPYSERHTPGTDVAMAMLSRRPLKPPGRGMGA